VGTAFTTTSAFCSNLRSTTAAFEIASGISSTDGIVQSAYDASIFAYRDKILAREHRIEEDRVRRVPITWTAKIIDLDASEREYCRQRHVNLAKLQKPFHAYLGSNLIPCQ